MSDQRGPYGALALWVLHHKPIIALVALLLTLVSIGMATQLTVDGDVTSLLPEHHKNMVALKKLHVDTGGSNFVNMSFESSDEAELQRVTKELKAAFEGLDSVAFVVDELDPDLAVAIGLQTLEPSQLDELIFRLRGALAMGSAMNPVIASRLMEMGPLTDKIAQISEPSQFQGSGRLFVRPTGSSHDLTFSSALMTSINEIIADANLEGRGIDLVWMGGAYRHSVDDTRRIKSDLARTSGISAILVIVLLTLSFRSIKVTGLVMLPVVVGNAMCLALIYLLYGTINTYTSFGTAILIGLGVDFAIHLLSRFREERSLGVAMEEAIANAWDAAGPPCTTAALTSSAGFLALSVASFKGFSQMGIVLGLGLLFCLLAMLLLFPLLLPFLDRAPTTPPPPMRETSGGEGAWYRLAPVGLMVAVIVTGLAATALPPEFEYDISELRTEKMAWSGLTERQEQAARASFSPSVVEFGSASELIRAQSEIEQKLKADSAENIGRVVSRYTLTPADSTKRLDRLRALKGLTGNPNMRYLPPPIQKNLSHLGGWDDSVVPSSLLPEEVLSFLGTEQEDKHRLLFFPKGNMWDLREDRAFTHQVESLVEGRPVAGEYSSLGTLYDLIVEDVPKIAVLAFMMVFALTVIDLRRVYLVFGAMGTLLAGMIWAGLMVKTAGVKLSIINFVGIPILLGIGIDVVIHLLHRIRKEGPGGVRKALSTTGAAAAISTMTTILSFSSLVLAENRGIASLGRLVVVGLSTVFVSTALLIPLILIVHWRLNDEKTRARTQL